MILSGYIDHTNLRPEALEEDIERLCREAEEYGFKSVCVNPSWVSFSASKLEATDVNVCSVVGFPLGATSIEAKAFETRQAIIDGADEIDMVINIGRLKDGDYNYVRDDIEEVVKSANKRLVKVIIEAGMLTDEEKKKACQLAKEAGAHYVKTSTGFLAGGARLEDVELMKSVVGDDMGIKASGGIGDFKTALKFIDAGATRIGASAGIEIIRAMED